MNDEEQYFLQQAGTGIAVHQGVRHQKGYSFWGKLIKWVSPVVRLLGRTALSTGADIAQDVLDDKDWKESAKERLKQSGKDLAKKGIDKVRAIAQKSEGRKRKVMQRKKSTKKKKKKKKSDLLF